MKPPSSRRERARSFHAMIFFVLSTRVGEALALLADHDNYSCLALTADRRERGVTKSEDCQPAPRPATTAAVRHGDLCLAHKKKPLGVTSSTLERKARGRGYR